MQAAVIHSAFEDSPRTVAFVNIPSDITNTTLQLEYAYKWTNNIEGSWSLKLGGDANDNVTVVGEFPISKRSGEKMGLRSTSMNDQILLGNKKYKVSMIGFEEII